jgi:uncharacterized membrane protein
MAEQKESKSFKKKYRNLSLIVGVIGMWIMFFVVYFGVINDNSILTKFGMGVMAIVLALTIYFL